MSSSQSWNRGGLLGGNHGVILIIMFGVAALGQIDFTSSLILQNRPIQIKTRPSF